MTISTCIFWKNKEVIDTVRRLPQLGNRGAYLVQKMYDKLVEHRQYIRDNGVDLPEIRSWKWDG